MRASWTLPPTMAELGADMKNLEVIAEVERLEEVQALADSVLEEMECPMKVQMQIDIAIEELFVNIAMYAYPEGPGKAWLEAGSEGNTFIMRFTDEGIPFDPLKKNDPDITLSAEERGIGGLGIYMVKKTMDEVAYEYRDGRNILTIKKVIG